MQNYDRKQSFHFALSKVRYYSYQVRQLDGYSLQAAALRHYVLVKIISDGTGKYMYIYMLIRKYNVMIASNRFTSLCLSPLMLLISDEATRWLQFASCRLTSPCTSQNHIRWHWQVHLHVNQKIQRDDCKQSFHFALS